MYRLLSLLSILSLLPPVSASALRINNDNDDTSYAQTTTPAVVATQFLGESTKSSTRRRHLAHDNKKKKRHDNKNHQHYEERMQKHEKRKEEKQKKKKKKKKKKQQLQQLDDTNSDKLLRTAVFDVGDEDEVESTFMTDYDETSTTEDDYDDWDNNNSGKNTITISFDDDWTISTTNETATIEAIRSNDELRVNRMYTYGAPSIIKGSSSQYHLNMGCIPGLRIYTIRMKLLQNVRGIKLQRLQMLTLQVKLMSNMDIIIQRWIRWLFD